MAAGHVGLHLLCESNIVLFQPPLFAQQPHAFKYTNSEKLPATFYYNRKMSLKRLIFLSMYQPGLKPDFLLFGQCHLTGDSSLVGRNPVEIHTGGPAGTIPDNLMLALHDLAVKQGFHFLSQNVIDLQ